MRIKFNDFLHVLNATANEMAENVKMLEKTGMSLSNKYLKYLKNSKESGIFINQISKIVKLAGLNSLQQKMCYSP